MGFSHIHCPGSQGCAFQVIPTVPYYYEPSCHAGMLGCKADGVHDECRFCGEAPFESVQCPRPHEEVEICQSNIGLGPCHISGMRVAWTGCWDASPMAFTCSAASAAVGTTRT